MRTPEQILRDALAAQARLGVDEGITWGVAYRAVALAQAEAAREEFMEGCARMCPFCAAEAEGFDEDPDLSAGGWVHRAYQENLCDVRCAASNYRADFARRHPEVKP